MPDRRLVATAGTAVAAAGFAASLAAAYAGMRDVMVEAGGFCASGGPYEIAQECDGEQIALLTGGIVGMLVCWAIFAAFASWVGWGALGGSLLMWAALFGALGWNFVELGLDPPGQDELAWGWIVSGAVFWVMAAGGLVPVVAMGVSRLRRGEAPSPPPTAPPPRPGPPIPGRLARPAEDEPR